MSFRPRFTFSNESYRPPISNMNPHINRPFLNEANQGDNRAFSQNYLPVQSNKNPSFFSSNPPPTFNAVPQPTHSFSAISVPRASTPVHGQQPINIVTSEPYKSHPSNLPNSNFQFSSAVLPNNQSYSNQPSVQSSSANKAFPSDNTSGNINFNMGNSSFQNFRYPIPNIPYNNLPPLASHQGYQSVPSASSNIPSFPFPPPPRVPLHQNFNISSLPVNNLALNPPNISNSAMPPVSTDVTQVSSSNFQSTSMTLAQPPPISSGVLGSFNFVEQSNSSKNDEYSKLSEFLKKFSITKKKKGNQVSVPEFRCALKSAMYIMKYLCEKRCKLKNLLNASENEWTSEMQSIADLKEELSTLCSFISAPSYLNSLLKKLKSIKKKREQKKKTKQNKFSLKIKAEQNRKDLNQEIDKWLDDIKEKNLKLKRELEMKKEADFILLEVRRKIHEAKKTLEKIKIFEKLRHARQANALKKGLHVLVEHSEKFEKKVTTLKETMLKQLNDYEAEEKALKVMLETEQEGQLEEEAQWKIKKAKTIQQKRQNHIRECLFGISDDPPPTDPLYLFHKFHTSANSSTESLIQIRSQWDVYLAKDGEVVPRQWVVPAAPSSKSWGQYLITKS